MNAIQTENYQRSALDDVIARIIFPIIAIIILYWIGTGVVKLYNWVASLGPYQSWWWKEIGLFLLRNFSIVFIIYTIICLQAAGIAEFKLKKPFLISFGLALVITPPLMIALYAKPRRNVKYKHIGDRKNEN